MRKPIAEFSKRVSDSCRANHCDADGCRVNLAGAPPVRVIVDMEKCKTLPIPANQKRCDYLFVGEARNSNLVVPIELKGGRPKASIALEQIAGGVKTADAWLPQGSSFQFVPVLAHGKKIHRHDFNVLRSRRISFRGQRKGTVLIRCGDPLTKALNS